MNWSPELDRQDKVLIVIALLACAGMIACGGFLMGFGLWHLLVALGIF